MGGQLLEGFCSWALYGTSWLTLMEKCGDKMKEWILILFLGGNGDQNYSNF